MVLMEIERLPDHDDGGERTGVIRVQTVIGEAVSRVQNELFDIGAEMACPPKHCRITWSSSPKSKRMCWFRKWTPGSPRFQN